MNNGCCSGESEESEPITYRGEADHQLEHRRSNIREAEPQEEKKSASIVEAMKWLIADLFHSSRDGENQIDKPKPSFSRCKECTVTLDNDQTSQGCTRSQTAVTAEFESSRVRTAQCLYCVSSPRRLLLVKLIDANISFARLCKQLLILPCKASCEELHEHSLFVAIKTLPDHMRRLIGGLHLGMTSPLNSEVKHGGSNCLHFIRQAVLRLVQVMQLAAGAGHLSAENLELSIYPINLSIIQTHVEAAHADAALDVESCTLKQLFALVRDAAQRCAEHAQHELIEHVSRILEEYTHKAEHRFRSAEANRTAADDAVEAAKAALETARQRERKTNSTIDADAKAVQEHKLADAETRLKESEKALESCHPAAKIHARIYELVFESAGAIVTQAAVGAFRAAVKHLHLLDHLEAVTASSDHYHCIQTTLACMSLCSERLFFVYDAVLCSPSTGLRHA